MSGSVSSHANAGRTAASGWLDISKCVVVTAGPVSPKALPMLMEEVQKRSGVKFAHAQTLKHARGEAAIVIATRQAANKAGVDPRRLPSDDRCKPVPDGFVLHLDLQMRKAPSILAVGNDPRGALFAVGCLLRTMRYGEGTVEVPKDLSLLSAPRHPLRGHQLGYRPRSNTYDQWSLEQYEQYIRDLIVWGANAIELIPPQSSYDNISGKPEFQRRAWEMNIRLSQLIGGDYGLEVHAWIPVDDRVVPGTEFGGLKEWQMICPSDPEGRKYLLDNRRRLFADMPDLDAVFVPAGDPGRCPCNKCANWAKTLLDLCAEIAQILAAHHPKAKLWVSDQLLTPQEVEYFYQYLAREQPEWFGGLVWGPSSVEPLRIAREHLWPRYPIRFYPDITHTLRCQYPVIDWDQAYALIEGREVSNPRPLAQKGIHDLLSPYTCGAITYSDGAHDDVNKIVWSALDWDPAREAHDIVLEYARYFVGEDFAQRFTEGIFALEKNWGGPLAAHGSVEETLRFWGALEADAPPSLKQNWRFQLALFRAYLDAFVRKRLLADIEAEQGAYEELSDGPLVGADTALRRAHKLLDISRRRPVATDLRERIEALAKALRESIGMKLGAKFGAEPERADVLDDLDEPVNNAEWLMAEMEKLLHSDNEAEKNAGISRLLHWEDPGPGGFYDDLGNPAKQPHLVYPKPVSEDPGRLETAAQEFDYKGLKGGRLSWRSSACAFRKSALQMRYEGLDPDARYLLRVIYPPHRPGTSVRLIANERFELQPMSEMPRELLQREYEIPPEATRSGKLELTWTRQGGRGVSVAEVWLVPQGPGTASRQ